VTHVAAAFGGKGIVDYIRGAPPVINDRKLVALFNEAAALEIGAERVLDIPYPVMGSDDFAFYVEKIPGLFFRVGTANEDPRTRLISHSPELIFDEQALGVGMRVMCRAALAYLGKG
jgi:metal-dependent amidase/aminoacylase/carboxypeptidase family protein